MSLRSTLLATTAITASALLLAGCSSAASGDDDAVRIGVVGASDPYWATYEKAAEDEGIDVEIVDFTDYNQPNPALTEGEIDLNQFQHLVYLSQYNTSADADLVPIGATAIYPLGLYSTQYDSVDDIPEGATVAVPDDASNQARGLLVLQSAGLIELKDGGSILSSVDDVDTSSSKVEVTALDAALTATSLPDVAAAIVNNDYLEGAGLAASDAIAEDDPSDPNAIPYVNVFAARSEDADNETYGKLVEIYQNTQAVLDGVSEQSGGTAIFVKTPAEELQSTLETVEKDTASQAG
ncbi:methionine ABC transporter substrate-binding protein [Rathayibacter sp. VKM Ac-2759]|uniref:MetQ/NlpA family ABC transporter substrate-binding protein n=1 Tax=Rathayibacter sp. VKM Ac-2759 TaxID=2609252 RepID=UPI001318EE6A|nr:MetQ/NlpA family ABC transporter substrate-binding protein [Rathayibacter sp. VKM Ac-2759]QHC68019.1 methionine ABC transporter substrate-binding protein [Rathayibacter sp. VKM Ac-2759]